jgi:hypothetical protein
MRSVYEQRLAEATAIEGRISSGRDVFVRTTKFARVCNVLWPDEKIAAKLAALSGRDERTAKRWLAGEFEPPICVVLYVFNEIFKRE